MNILIKGRPFRSCLIGIFLLFTVGSMSNALANNFEQEWSGWFMFNSDADTNGDMAGGGENTWAGRGTFGRADNHAATDVLFTGAPCDFDPDTNLPIAFTLDVIAHSNILRTRDGDQLFRMLSSSPPSIICFNPTTQIGNMIGYLDVVGGTGRFEGATGSTVLNIRVEIVGGQNSATGTEKGEVFLFNGRGHHDDDDSDSD